MVRNFTMGIVQGSKVTLTVVFQPPALIGLETVRTDFWLGCSKDRFC
jgi:hypothetical protein